MGTQRWKLRTVEQKIIKREIENIDIRTNKNGLKNVSKINLRNIKRIIRNMKSPSRKYLKKNWLAKDAKY